MVKLWILSFIFFVTFLSVAQTGQLSGKVLDAKTLEPLPFANVYINNTTIGTTTSVAGEFLLRNIPLGTAEVIYSYVGYQPYQVKMLIRDGVTTAGVIKLLFNEKQLSEVEIKTTRDKLWEKQFRRFRDVFLGTGQQAEECKINNPWVIDFIESNNVLIGKASMPLEIVNNYLGYTLSFQLKDFKFNGDKYSIIGNTRFSEILPKDARQALQWRKNRERAYIGSVQHLMKSIVDKEMFNEGFRLYTDKVRGAPRTNNFSYEIEHNLVAYDTNSMVMIGSSPNEYNVLIKDKIEVHYIFELSKSNFYKDVSHPVSWLEVKNSIIKVNKDGVLLNPSEVVISGDMSELRVSSMLPLDYKRGEIIRLQTKEELSAKRLEEKAYLHTDKPYYYPGETIWFSGYMSYRYPSMKDTLSNVLYVDLYNSKRELVKVKTIQIEDGRAVGSFRIPLESEGDLMIRAYTNWMKNYGTDQFFYKTIPVLNILDKVDEKAEAPITKNERIQISFDKSAYKKRDSVKLRLKLSLPEDGSLAGSFSVSVTDAKQVVPVADLNSIVNSYSLESELPQAMPLKFKYNIERGIGIKGVYTNKKGKGEKAKLTIIQNTFDNIFQITTDDKGYFEVTDLIFYDSMKFAIQHNMGKVKLLEHEYPILPSTLPKHNLPILRTESPQRMNLAYNFDDAIMLNEVEIKGEKIKTKIHYENPYGKPDVYLKGNDLIGYGNSVAAAIPGKIQGYKLINYELHWYLISTRGEFTRANGAPAEPLLLIDNAQFIGGSGETVGDRLNLLNPAQIDHIEVSSMISTQIGATGANGLISVYTKRAEPEEFKALPIFKIKGFDSQQEFISPDYGNPFTDKSVADYRSTIYWNPLLKISSSIGVELSFFTSDLTGKYRVVVEGITEKGLPLRSESFIIVED